MIDTVVKILDEHGPHFLIEAILIVGWLTSVRSRNSAAKLIDDMHKRRMDDFERVTQLAQKAKKIINGHGETNDKD